jgi:hypothetical protein
MSVEHATAEWFVTPFIGVKFAGDARGVDLDQGAGDTKLMFGGMAAFVGEGLFGVEADFAYLPRFFEQSSGLNVSSSYVWTLMGNVILTPPRDLTGYSLRPFLSGGAGMMRVAIADVLDVLGAGGLESNEFGINIGGGAIGGLTNRTSIRFDLRYFKTITDVDPENAGSFGSRLSFWRGAVGITLR